MRNRRWIGVFAAITLVLAACGGDGTADTTAPGADTTAPGAGTTAPADDTGTTEGSAATTAPGGGVSGDLSVVYAWTGSEEDAFQAVLAGFEEANPDVNLEPIQIPFGEMSAQLTQEFAAGSGPDVATALPGLIRLFSSQGYLMPLDDMWSQWIADGAYTESLKAIASVEGTPYGVWFKGNVNALIWNTPDRMAELGIAPPETWDQFTAALDTIQAAGDVPFVVGGADVWVPTQWWDPILTRVAGPDAFNGLLDGSVGWDDPAVAEAFDAFGQFIASYFPDDALDRGFVEATCARVAGEAHWQNQGAFVSLVTRGSCDESLVPGDDYSFFLMPKYDESAPNVQNVSGDLFMVNAATANPEGALALAEYLGSADAQAIWASLGGYVAPNLKVPVDVYPNILDGNAAELWVGADVALYDLDDYIGGEIQSVLRSSLQQFIRDQDTQAIVNAMVEVDERVRG